MEADEILAGMRAVCDAATKGPWLTAPHSNPDCAVRYVYPEGASPIADEVCSTYGELEANVANSTFIAAARTGWPRAIAAVEYLREQVARIPPDDAWLQGVNERVTRILAGEGGA